MLVTAGGTMAFEIICVPVALQRYIDFTPVALRQLELAQALSQVHGATLHLLSVNAPVALLPGVESTEEKLERFAHSLDGDCPEVVTAVREGKPSREIYSYVEEVSADLVIVGSHSKRGPLDVGLGSTAAILARELASTLLMVRPTLQEMERTRELMIPRYPIIFPYG
jgi:nucleotide-binding universal stress UspA family protein